MFLEMTKPQKFNKASCCIVTWIMPDIWLKLNFSCSLKIKLVMNILGYLKCSRPISSSENKKILLTTRNVRLTRGQYAKKNTIPTLQLWHFYHKPIFFLSRFVVWQFRENVIVSLPFREKLSFHLGDNWSIFGTIFGTVIEYP